MCTDWGKQGRGGAQAWGSPSGKGQTAQEMWPGPWVSPQAPQPPEPCEGTPCVCWATREGCGDIRAPGGGGSQEQAELRGPQDCGPGLLPAPAPRQPQDPP